MKGIENNNASLSKVEIELVDKFLVMLKDALVTGSRIKSNELEDHFFRFGIKIYPSRVRAIIHHIRSFSDIKMGEQRYFLIADTTGYWLSSDPVEVADYIESLTSRVESIASIRDSAKAYLRRVYPQPVAVQASLL